MEASTSCGLLQLIQKIPPLKCWWWRWMKSFRGSEGLTPEEPLRTCSVEQNQVNSNSSSQ